VIDHPEGYPHLAALVDSDASFMLYRRFGYLQARVLLDKQAELRELERDLEDLDSDHAETNPLWLRSRELDNVECERHKSLLREIEQKYKEYSKLLQLSSKVEMKILILSLADILIKGQTIAGFDRPNEKDYARVQFYFQKKAPLCRLEQGYIYNKEDIVTLKPDRDSTWLDVTVEKIPQKFPCWLTQVGTGSPYQDPLSLTLLQYIFCPPVTPP
jgi:hypothetical protein